MSNSLMCVQLESKNGERLVALRQESPLSTFLLSFSCSVLSDSLWPHGLQHTRSPSFTVSWSLLRLMFHWDDVAVQYYTEVPSLCNKKRKRNKIHTYLKGGKKAISIHRQHASMHGKCQTIHLKAPRNNKWV